MVIAAAAQVSASAAAPPRHHPKATPHHKPQAPALPRAPASLRDRIDELGKGFDGRVGIAVQSINDGWETGWKDHELYPQQSISKLWVSITALDAVDRGQLQLADKVTLTRSDLTLFHQPIAAEILKDGSYTTTVDDLLARAITTSDNMSHTHTGPNRLRGGLKDGWALSHKTGTGQELGGVQAGYNDIGILTAPDGRTSYAVAVMIKKTSTPLPVRMRLMNNVVRAVIAQYEMEHGGSGAGRG